jgi:hypothetical protein
MQITVGQLRRLIREMGFEKKAGTLTMGGELPPEDDDPKRVRSAHRAVKKYFSSRAWDQKARAQWKFLRTPIWVIPTFLHTEDIYARVYHVPWADALPHIEEADFDPGEVQAHLAAGGTVMLVGARSVFKDFWPSPWNTLHAIFDDEHELSPEHAALIEGTTNVLEGWIDRFIGDMYYLTPAMTMKSAREGKLLTLRDCCAELLAQSVISPRGCVLKPYEAGDKTIKGFSEEERVDINKKLARLQDIVNGMDARGKLDRLFRGHVVMVKSTNLRGD